MRLTRETGVIAAIDKIGGVPVFGAPVPTWAVVLIEFIPSAPLILHLATFQSIATHIVYTLSDMTKSLIQKCIIMLLHEKKNVNTYSEIHQIFISSIVLRFSIFL